jgi:hypothetical protein
MVRQAFGVKASVAYGCLNVMLGSGHTEKGEIGEEQSEEHAISEFKIFMAWKTVICMHRDMILKLIFQCENLFTC